MSIDIPSKKHPNWQKGISCIASQTDYYGSSSGSGAHSLDDDTFIDFFIKVSGNEFNFRKVVDLWVE